LKQQKNMARAVELLQQMDEKEKLIEEAAANAAVAQQKVNKAQADFDAAAKANGTNPAANARLYATQMQGVATALREAEAELKPYVDEQARLQAEYDISAAEASRLEKEMVGLAETQAEAAAQLRFAGMEEMGLKIEDVTKRLDTLADAYEQVRDAAVSSVEDQFELWDKAAGLTGKDAIGLDKLITGAQTQAQYWENYESNLQALLASESEFAGLGEVVAELSTKGLEGASAISALADALEDPKKIQKYIDKWNTLQGLEKTTADTLTKMRVDLTTEMDGVQQDLESFVASMSLGDEAKQSGIETLRGLIEGLGDKGLMYEVETAYRNVLNAGIAQLGGRPVISQEEMDLMRKYSNAAIYYTVDGSHAGGLENVPYDGYIAELHKGERVLTAEENRMLSNPQVVAASQYFVDARLMDALSAYAVDVSVPELEMKLPSSSVSGINLTLNVSFNIDADVASNTPALMGTLEQASAKMSEDLREAFADLMDDYQRDQARRVW
jgi:hypothetical protein